ncbi:MAG: hypothetical protein AAFX99_35290, partial [Myxococcota bacterium]
MRSNTPPTSSSHPIAPYLEAVAPHHRTTFTHHVEQLTHRMRHRYLDRSALEASPLWTRIQANPEQGLSLMWECMATQPPCPTRDVLWAELLTTRLPHPHRGWMAAHLWLRLTAEQSAQAHHYVRAVYYFGHRAWDDLNALV